MSLIRKASKATLRVNTDDFPASMDQKNGIIACLQNEVEQLRTNQQKYDRVKEQLARAKVRFEALLRDHETNACNNQERLQLSTRSVSELRIQIDHLVEELKLKGQILKESKFSTQQLIGYQNKKEDECTQIKIKFQEQKSLGEVKKMEEERTRLQISQLREEVEKGKRENISIRTQGESINEKCYKTQSYIRSLLREESNLNENLCRVEQENNKIDSNISQMQTIVSITQNELSRKEKDCQQLRFRLASKELEKKKVQNEIKEKVKLLSSQKEKWKALCEQLQIKRGESVRFQAHLNEASSEINFIISKNNQISSINDQLKEDLKVSQRHLENVVRVNKSIEGQIQQFRQINMKALTKLQEPLNNRTNTFYNSISGAKWGNTSRVTDYETGDFDKKTLR